MIYHKFKCENCGYEGRFYYLDRERSRYCFSFGCKSCKKVVNYCGDDWVKASNDLKCLDCSNQLIDYPHELKSFNTKKDRLECPKCGKKSLRIIPMVGMHEYI